MAVGDVTSNERGSGARFNDGKPNLSLIPPYLLPTTEGIHWELTDALQSLMFEGQEGPLRRWFYSMMVEKDACAKVFEYGSTKYAAWNWAKGMKWSIPIACALRHADALWNEKEYLDQESGLPHIGHILCNLVMLLYYMDYFPEGNDLPHVVLNKALLKKGEDERQRQERQV